MSTSSSSQPGLPRGLFVAGFLVILLWGAVEARTFLIPVCISALLAFMMAPLVRWLRQTGLPEWLAITCSTLLLLLPFLVIAFFLIHQCEALVHDFPTIKAWFEKELVELAHSSIGERLDIPDYFDLSSIGEQVAGSVGQGAQIVLQGLKTVLEAGTHIALVLLFAVVMLLYREHLYRSAERILARFETIESAAVLNAVVSLIERFLIARLIIILIIGALAVGALLLFGVRYSVVLGVYLGVATLVPVVGYLSGVLIAVGVALATGHSQLSTMLLVAALAVIGVVESHLLTPKFVGNRLNINALATFLGLFAGELLWGIWGVFLSVPILGILRIAFSAVPSLQPWGELLAEREDKALTERLVRQPPESG